MIAETAPDSADSEASRIDFETRYNAVPEAERLAWLYGPGDDGGSLWWARAVTDLTCPKPGETAKAFVARVVGVRAR